MFKISWCKVWNTVIVLLMANKSGFCEIVPNVNCPKIFQYNFDGTKWFGIIQLKDSGQSFKLNVDMALDRNTEKNYTGSFYLQIHRKETVGIKIKFPLPSILPKLTRIVFNEKVICIGSPDGNPESTILKLEQTDTGQIMFQTSIRGITEDENTGTVTTVQSSNCGELAGRFKYYPVGYSHGEYERGTWPWQAAIFLRIKTITTYKCVGSLITNNAVITAAQCVGRHKYRDLKPNNFTVYLGLHNIDELELDGIIKSGVSEIYSYETYKFGSGDGNIAILQLAEKVEFSDFIQPACLWSGSIELESILGESGYCAGWGTNVSGLPPGAPFRSNSKIIPQEGCFQETPATTLAVSNRTFCAGSGNGESPCMGDAGAGFYIKKGSQWILRGIVSIAIADEFDNYVVYADVAQYLNWINEKISQLE